MFRVSPRSQSPHLTSTPPLPISDYIGSVAPGQVGASFQARRNLLDHMASDVRKFIVNSVHRKRELEAYLSAFEASALSPSGC